jgi:hypothetical protein
MGLGSLSEVKLADARQVAAKKIVFNIMNGVATPLSVVGLSVTPWVLS